MVVGSAAMKSLTVEIPEDLHRRIKAKVALEGSTIQAAVRGLLEGYVGDA